MEETSSSVWQRKGSSIVFDKKSLGGLISAGAVVSLREAMSWSVEIPAAPPVPGRTILVSGLETVLEIMMPQDGEHFLTRRIRPLLISLQNHWTDCGVVFGFSSNPKAFQETSLEEEVLFRRRDSKTVRLSRGLWDGSSSLNMKRVVREGEKPGEE
ncbi:MAG TPA: hypothetical protein VEF34_12600, partial [Syntrophobacteraceae bacterium]|nr:hypothetical protein [Syntrophobacteraceae bacterium]